MSINFLQSCVYCQ